MGHDEMNEALLNGVITIHFSKNDGTVREMKCTKNMDLIPVDKHPKHVDESEPKEDLVKVFDIDLQEWRSFKPSRLLGYDMPLYNAKLSRGGTVND